MGYDATPRSQVDGTRRIQFGDAVRPLLAFVVAVSALVVLVNVAVGRLLAVDGSGSLPAGVTVAGTLALGAVAVAVLRHEDVRLADVGLARDLALPGIAAVGGLWVGLNAVGIGLAVATGRYSSLGYVYDVSLLAFLGGVGVQWLVVGPVEELAYRGYLQNKVIALLDGSGDRVRTAVGIAAAGVVFAAVHVPNRLVVEGVPPADLPAGLVALVVAALIYGVIYESTGNLVFVGLLHGTFNQWPLFVDPRMWPTALVVAWAGCGVALLGVTIWWYRSWIDGGSAGPRDG